jgi:anti-sigma factor RsiW
VDRMSPPEGCHPYREQIGAFALGKLEGGELAAVHTHLNSCPACRAEVGELRTVVAALADGVPAAPR